MVTSNRLLGGIAFILGVAVWLAAGGIQLPAEGHTLSPRFFPKLLAGALALLGAILFALGKGLPFDAVYTKIRHPRNVCLAASTLLFAVAFGHVDYRLLSPAYIAVVLWILGTRKAKDIIVVSVSATAILYLVFRYGFMVLLPEAGSVWN
jgi:hypothetical protein